jgi:hypothetical protein
MGEAEEKIEDEALLAQIRRQALRVNLKAFAAGVLLTLAALALPMLR